MEKTITIDGKQIRLKSTGATPIRYKAQFKKDYFSELLKLGALDKFRVDDEGNIGEIDPDVIEKIDFDVFYNVIWTMAKTANATIDDPITWLDQFEEFPIVEILSETQDMLISTLGTKKSSKKK